MLTFSNVTFLMSPALSGVTLSLPLSAVLLPGFARELAALRSRQLIMRLTIAPVSLLLAMTAPDVSLFE